MPFVGTLNPAWYAAAVDMIKDRSMTFVAGGQSIYHDCAVGQQVAATSSSSTSNKKKRDAPPQPTRKMARTSKELLDMPYDDEHHEAVDDGVDMEVGALKDEPMWFIEHYAGRRPQYLLSNTIVGVGRAHDRARDPVAPVATLFSACWRRVDEANKAVKENVMLHSLSSIHKMQEPMLYFDFMWSTALWTAFVFAAEARGAQVQGDGELYKFEQFGIELAQLLQKIVTVCRGRHKGVRKGERALFVFSK
jgi:hypothetical protein